MKLEERIVIIALLLMILIVAIPWIIFLASWIMGDKWAALDMMARYYH